MPKLIVSTDGVVVKEVQLTKDRSTIGRRPYNDIVIDNLAVSGEHAAIRIAAGQATLEDLGSTNGTYVNGKPIKKQVLAHDDMIEMGKYQMRYLVHSGTTVPADLPSAGARSSRPMGLDTQLATPAPAVSGARVRVLSGNSAGRELPLVKDVTTIGKPGLSVASITRKANGFHLTHVEGSQTATVNNVALDAGPIALRNHDVIELGGIRLEFIES